MVVARRSVGARFNLGEDSGLLLDILFSHRSGFPVELKGWKNMVATQVKEEGEIRLLCIP